MSSSTGPTSLADLQKGAKTIGDSGTDPTVKPSWLTPDLYSSTHISQFFNQNLFSFACAWHCSLTLGFSLPDLLKPLVYTKQSSTPKTAQKRYMDTFLHLSNWHEGDIFEPATTAFDSVQEVRGYHAAVRKNMTRDQPGTTWISAYNMGCVQAGFFAAISMHGDKFGLSGKDNSEENMVKYVAFWRCVGRQLGVADQFNLCSRDRTTVTNVLGQIINEVLLPDEANPPDEYAPMADAYVDGLNLLFCGIPVISVKSSLAFSFWTGGYPQSRWPKLTCCDWVRFWMIRITMLCVGALPFVRTVLSWATKRTLHKQWQEQEKEKEKEKEKEQKISSLSAPLLVALKPVSSAATCPMRGLRMRNNVSSPPPCGFSMQAKGIDPDVGVAETNTYPSRPSPCCCFCRSPMSGPTVLCSALSAIFVLLISLFFASIVGVYFLGQIVFFHTMQ
jgi:hypothetical protein